MRSVGARRAGAAGVALAGLLAVSACAPAVPSTPGTAGRSGDPASQDPPATRGGSPTLTITPADGTQAVRLDAVVTVIADSGSIDSVVLHSTADATAIAGSASRDGQIWTSEAPLDPASTYVVEASAHGLGGDVTTARARFLTIATPRRLTTTVTPDDGATVGVGMPIVLRFNTNVAADRQANLVQHVQVQTSPGTVGAWRWFSPNEVHWRPKDLWAPGTTVTVAGDLRGVDAGNGVWGLGGWHSAFVIGEKHVSIVDAAAHQMQVFSNGQLIHTYPVSTGRPAFPTLSGTLVVWFKLQKLRMTSVGLGIPVNAPGGYDEDVFWDTAISLDGFYIHAAPWSVASQGRANVSHGCVNLSTARAIEFYGFSRPGDVVQVIHTPRVADFSDGEGDWQIPFDQYANSAVTSTAGSAAAPGGL